MAFSLLLCSTNLSLLLAGSNPKPEFGAPRWPSPCFPTTRFRLCRASSSALPAFPLPPSAAQLHRVVSHASTLPRPLPPTRNAVPHLAPKRRPSLVSPRFPFAAQPRRARRPTLLEARAMRSASTAFGRLPRHARPSPCLAACIRIIVGYLATWLRGNGQGAVLRGPRCVVCSGLRTRRVVGTAEEGGEAHDGVDGRVAGRRGYERGWRWGRRAER